MRRRDDRNLGLNLDADPANEVTIYDDELATFVGLGILAALVYKILKS